MLLVERVLCVSVTMSAFVMLVLAAGCGSEDQVERTEASQGETITIELREGGGFVARFSKQ